MRKHKGFTLVELVVVVMILGILAAVAAPKLLNTSSAATENGIKQSLSVVRDAIERYAAENGGALPAAGTTDDALFVTQLTPYLRGGVLPTCPVAGKNADLVVVNSATPIVGQADGAGQKSWKYSSATGQFIVNSTSVTKTDPGVTYDEL